MRTVAQVALAAGVSAAAVRARLSDGGLRGEQVLRGKRVVWEVDEASAAEYVSQHRGQVQVHAARAAEPAAGEALRVDTEGLLASVRPASTKFAVTPRAPAPDSGGRPTENHAAREVGSLRELTTENARLKAALSALTRAHLALVELVELSANGDGATPQRQG